MHDFLLAKEIVDEVLRIAEENNLKKVSKVVLDIGEVSLAHDGLAEHSEDISVDNLKFGLDSIAKNTLLEGADFAITKNESNHWKLIALE